MKVYVVDKISLPLTVRGSSSLGFYWIIACFLKCRTYILPISGPYYGSAEHIYILASARYSMNRESGRNAGAFPDYQMYLKVLSKSRSGEIE